MSRRRSRHYGMRGIVVSAGGLLLALAAGGVVGRAASAAIILINDGRYVQYTWYGSNPPEPSSVKQAFPDPPFSEFYDAVGDAPFYAEQGSVATSDRISGFGSSLTDYHPFGFSGESILDITFEVDTAAEYDLYGSLGSIYDYVGSYLEWREDGVLQFKIYGPDCLLPGPYGDCSAWRYQGFSTTLSLTPGVTYELTAAAQQFNPYLQTAGGEFEVTFSGGRVIPEPSTALLLALGLVGIAAGRRRAGFSGPKPAGVARAIEPPRHPAEAATLTVPSTGSINGTGREPRA